MKVDPPLFPPTLGQPSNAARPSAEASEARKAFAALLSAANQRSTLPRDLATTNSAERPVSVSNSTPSNRAEETSATSSLARPGRVIDIRV